MLLAPELEARVQANPEILLPDSNRPSAACLLDENIVHSTLLATVEEGACRRDLSFTRQIQTVTDEWETIDSSIPGPPEAFLFTAYSALPFIPMFQGYYGASGKEMPPFSYINASREKEWQTPEAINQEAERLGRFLTTIEHVCVVDEHVITGQTLKLAHDILKRTDVAYMTTIRGQWDAYGVSPALKKQKGSPAAFMASELSPVNSATGYMYEFGEIAYQLIAANQQTS